jgi:hypothetical protein
MSSSLAERVVGAVHAPTDAGYAPELAGFNTSAVHRPDLVVAAASAEDVVQAVRFAGERGHRVHVQATGHGGHGAVTSGLLISTRRLDGLSIDVASATATIGAGVRWGAVIAGAAEHGLAPVAGSSPTVGVVGYVLGGGLGPLARSHGFSSDYLVRLAVVTGAGDLVEASAESHADLFWALRGGKLGLGVVTEVGLRLVPLRSLYAGALFFDEPHIEAALRAWVDWTATAHARVTTSVAIVRFPARDAVPPPFRGRRLLALRFAYPDDLAEGARLAAPLRAAAPVYLDSLGELPAAQVARIHNDPTDPLPAWTTGMLLGHADQGLASVLLRHFGPDTDPPFVAAEVRHLGEATSRDVAEGSAAGGRAAAFTLSVISARPDLFEHVVPAAADRLIAEVQPWLSPETNINFAGKPRSPEHLASAWPAATLARLAEVRRRHDPRRLFAFE